MGTGGYILRVIENPDEWKTMQVLLGRHEGGHSISLLLFLVPPESETGCSIQRQVKLNPTKKPGIVTFHK